MKKIIFIVLLGICVWIAFVFLPNSKNKASLENNDENINTEALATTSDITSGNIPAFTVIAKNLNIPWDMAFLPDGRILLTERVGTLSVIDKETGEKKVILDEAATHKGEGGLLGLVLHPDFSSNHFIYIYLSAPGNNGNTENRIERYKFEDDKLTDKKIIISKIPGAIYHDGGRMKFGPDGLLYITTGDATTPKIAQDLKSLGGKVLRIKDDGSFPEDNFSGAIYSYGHRNSQGLAWDDMGRLWSTEHGRSGIKSGLDEINIEIKGGNYGWPDSEGDTVLPKTIAPVLHSGEKTTWAPASLLYYNGSLFFGGLLGESLYEAVLDGEKIKEFKVHYNKQFGRIRTIILGPDNMFYITTSNRDGRGKPTAEDDKIIQINPLKLN